MSVTISRTSGVKEKVVDYWRDNYDGFVKDYVSLIAEHKVTNEEILSVVFALRNHFPYITPSELVELIKMYGNMKSGITGMLGQIPVLMIFTNLTGLDDLIMSVSASFMIFSCKFFTN